MSPRPKGWQPHLSCPYLAQLLVLPTHLCVFRAQKRYAKTGAQPHHNHDNEEPCSS